MSECEVIPFPLARRQALIAGIALSASRMKPETASRHVENQLKLQAKVLARRGVEQAAIDREVASLSFTVWNLIWKSTLAKEGC